MTKPKFKIGDLVGFVADGLLLRGEIVKVHEQSVYSVEALGSPKGVYQVKESHLTPIK